MSRDGDLRRAVHRNASFAQTLRAVAWSFFGVRKAAEYEKDMNELNPVHLVIAGVLAAVIFIAALITLVSWVLSSGFAT